MDACMLASSMKSARFWKAWIQTTFPATKLRDAASCSSVMSCEHVLSIAYLMCRTKHAKHFLSFPSWWCSTSNGCWVNRESVIVNLMFNSTAGAVWPSNFTNFEELQRWSCSATRCIVHQSNCRMNHQTISQTFPPAALSRRWKLFSSFIQSQAVPEFKYLTSIESIWRDNQRSWSQNSETQQL